MPYDMMYETNGFENLIEDISSAAAGLAAGFGVLVTVAIIVAIAALALSYYLYCVPLEKAAAKLGYKKTWMAYVPVARNVLRMQMTGMSMWKMFFVGSIATGIVAGLILGILSALFFVFGPTAGTVMSCILSIAYFVLNLWFTYEYNVIFFTRFGYDPVIALFAMFVPVVNTVFSYIVAFSNRVVADSANTTSGSGHTGGNTATAVAPSMVGLEGIYGAYAGAKIEMKPTDVFVIGRDSTLSNIIINYEKVSKRHCSVKYNAIEGCYEVVDFSTNGTFAGNRRLDINAPAKLARGTIIAIGDKENQFRLL